MGAVAQSRRRIRWLLLGMALPMVALAIWMFALGRIGAGGLSLGSAALALYGLRLRSDLDPLWLEITNGRLGIQLRSRRDEILLLGLSARRLETEEIAHVLRLASTAGMMFASAAFESHTLGSCNLFATNLEKAVLIEVDDPDADPGDDQKLRWIVTPDEPDDFVTAILEAGSRVA